MSKQKTKKKTGTAAEPISESAKANTVNGKRALYQSAAKEMLQSGINTLQEGVREMQAGVHEMQIKHNVDLFAFQVGVKEIQVGIKDQVNKYKVGAAAFQSGVAEMTSSIAEQIKANQEYTKQFYG